MSTGRLARAKQIGEDVEWLVLQDVDGLRAADDPEATADAAAVDTICPTTSPSLDWRSLPLVERGTRVEIKACRRRISNGSRSDRPGRWTLQRGQHDQLLDWGAVYLLAVYEGTDDRRLVRTVIAPASIIDALLEDSWYHVDRHEDQIAQLRWTRLAGGESSGK